MHIRPTLTTIEDTFLVAFCGKEGHYFLLRSSNGEETYDRSGVLVR